MKFTEHRDTNMNVVKHYVAGQVKVNDQTYTHSFFLTQKEIEPDWDCTDIDSLNAALIESLLSKQPEVIILGSGEQQRFPDPKWFAHCAQKGVGLEVMANDAACRTYNVLTTEERDVVLALILPKH